MRVSSQKNLYLKKFSCNTSAEDQKYPRPLRAQRQLSEIQVVIAEIYLPFIHLLANMTLQGNLVILAK